MPRLWRLILITFSVTLAVTPTHAETTSGTANVEIRSSITVSETAPLNFGIISTDNADIVSLAPSGAISAQNGASIAGSSSTGNFAAAGSANAAVTISFASGTLTGTGVPMTVNNLNHDAGGSPSFAGDGTLSFAVGADLVVNSGQTPGLYSGTYNVSVNYQ